MAKRLAVPSKEEQLIIVGGRDYMKFPRVQRFTNGTDIPSTVVDEIGNSSHVGYAADQPNVTLTFSAFDTGIRNYSVLTETDYTAYPAGGVDIVNLGEIDAILETKDATVADYSKSGHARRLQIRDFAYNYSVDGEATEDYTAVGSERRWLKYDCQVDRFTTGTTSFTLTQTPIQLKNGNYLLSVQVNGSYLTEVSTAPAAGEYRVVGTALTTGDTRTGSNMVLVVYHANPGGNNWADVSDTSMPAAIKGKDVKIYINGVEQLRVQSVTINGNLQVQPVREMGNRSAVGYQRQVPDITGTITVLDTDTDTISLLTNGVTGSGIEWQPGEGCTTSGLTLRVKLVDPCATTAPYTVLKTVYLPSFAITGDSYSVNVNQNAAHAFNYRSLDAHVIIYSGSY